MGFQIGIGLSLTHTKGVGWQSRLGTEGFRIFGGRMGTIDNSTTKTMQVTAELPVPSFKRVRIIIGGTSPGRNIGGASVAVLPNTTDLNGAAATHVAVTFGGSTTGAIGAAANNNRRAYLKSDWVTIASVPRDDAGTWPIILARIYESTASTIATFGDFATVATALYSNWATRTDGHLWAMRYNNGNCCQGTGTPANFSSTTDRDQNGIIGFEFETANGERVCTIMGAGDSITEGWGTYKGEGWGVPLCDQLHAAYPSTYFSWANIGWFGHTYAIVGQLVTQGLAAGLAPDICIFPNGSPNSASVPILDAEVTAMAAVRDTILSDLAGADIMPVAWTWIPTNPALKNYNASDSKRVAYNVATIADAVADAYAIADFSTAISGVTDGDGQVNMAVGSTTDNIHPNDVGNALFPPVAIPAVLQALNRI